MPALGAAAISGGALLVVYVATLAPSVTLWDSGEFLAAIHALGVPHPPGTPLFVYASNAWAQAFGWLPFAVAVNLASAVATATSAGCFAWLFTRWTGRALVGVAGALVGGGMAAVWQSATETEVYALATLAVALALVAADVAGTRWSVRHRVLIAFLFGLAVPLHISVLVAGPAVILLASSDRSGAMSVRAALAPAAAWCVAVGMGTVSALPLLAGGMLALVASVAPDGQDGTRSRRAAWLSLLVTMLGASFVLVMLVRARHDPAVNAGFPTTWTSLVDIVARRQYDVPPLWPRRAPLWLQLGNVVQYADWQVALGLSDAPGPSPWRTPITLVFAALGIAGSVWHSRVDRRSWKAMGLLLLCATLGVVTVLNLRAGPSFGWGVLPVDALREARERDYFFALAFLVAGLWCGCGVVALRDRLPRGMRELAMLLAVAPIALNWRGVDRRRAPDATLAGDFAHALLRPLPARAVLVVAGDNDSFPLWYAQEVEALRTDVTAVTIPLLGAGWYRAELARRHALLPADVVERWQGLPATLAAIGDAARRDGRPLMVAVSVEPDDRDAVAPGEGWRLEGMAYSRLGGGAASAGPLVDSVSVARAALSRAGALAGDGHLPSARDPAGRYVQRLLQCPAVALRYVRAGDSGARRLLESACNFR